MSVTTADARTVARRPFGGSLHRQRMWALYGSYAALIVFVIFFLIPPFHMFITSFKTSAEVSSMTGNPWIVRNPTLSNYVVC